MRKGIVVDWEVSGWVAVTGLLIAVSLQILQLRVLPFYPGSSGYASCFLGWAVMNCGLLLVSAYWLETVLARSLRLRRAVGQDGGAGRSRLPEARLFRANLEACTSFLIFVALLEVLFWVLFYVL
jgi:hypothetical protein